ncbi:MAG TPA: class I SAM-dependent methyltransferase [Bryobacteraceae bacterium]|nr:class I SAM-dependent methyltransferase [Bryobacteraceae bacterium]
MSELLNYSDTELLRLAQTVYDIPSLAAWRAAELKALRRCKFDEPVLEIGCGNGRFTSLLIPRVDWGVDINPREVELCARSSTIYRRVGCMDARRLEFADGVFATVFANCVVEHIPDLPRVLAECRRVLRPGGSFIATVPLAEMNRHLLLRTAWYGRLRAGQLRHLNLLAERDWMAALTEAGFSIIQTEPYLSAHMCELWDRVDGPLCMGAGPLTLGRAYRFTTRLMPGPLRSGLNRQWQHYFIRALESDHSETPCAMLIQARTAPQQSPDPDASQPPPAM